MLRAGSARALSPLSPLSRSARHPRCRIEVRRPHERMPGSSSTSAGSTRPGCTNLPATSRPPSSRPTTVPVPATTTPSLPRVRPCNPASAKLGPAQQVHQRPRTQRGHHRLGRELERRPPALRLESDRSRHHRQGSARTRRPPPDRINDGPRDRVPTLSAPRLHPLGSTRAHPPQNQPSDAHQLRNSGTPPRPSPSRGASPDSAPGSSSAEGPTPAQPGVTPAVSSAIRPPTSRSRATARP